MNFAPLSGACALTSNDMKYDTVAFDCLKQNSRKISELFLHCFREYLLKEKNKLFAKIEFLATWCILTFIKGIQIQFGSKKYTVFYSELCGFQLILMPFFHFSKEIGDVIPQLMKIVIFNHFSSNSIPSFTLPP